jgi:hypothetical protein
MKDKEAIAILAKLLNKKSLSAQEKEAIKAAIGVLSWTSLAESKIKAQKAKREKNVEWE